MEEEEDDDHRRRLVLKEVFPLLSGEDLAACICVCRQWRDVGRDDFLWKRLCERRWPSTCADERIGAVRGYRNLFSTFAAAAAGRRKKRNRAVAAPKLGFEDLEFYVDVWAGNRSVYSAVVAGPVVQSRIQNPPPGICSSMQQHLQESSEYKMSVPVCPPFEVSFSEDICMSMLVRRKDNNQVATIIHGSRFDYVDGPEHRAHAYDYLQISPHYPFLSEIRAWVALLLVDNKQGKREVFGIELDFLDTASSDDEVLCLLDILDWK